MREKIKIDSINALKSHDQARVDVLRYLISIIDKKALQLPLGQMTEADEMAVLLKELKNKEESKIMFANGQRDDLVKQVDFEIAVLKNYLPEEMGQAELESIVEEAVKEAGGVFGSVMKIVMSKVAGRVGGEKIAPLVKQKISEQ